MAWFKEIMERHDEVAKTLQEENLTKEQCVIAGDFVFYKAEIKDGEEKISINLKNDINKKHQQIIKECTEATDNNSVIFGYEINVSK